MLQVFKGAAVRSHENEFFRRLTLRLSVALEKRNINGILFGMPKCRMDENLQIDACLITKQSIIIIDFKEYSGNVTLPPHSDFRNSMWTCYSPQFEELPVMGGSAINPFVQLSKQRGKLNSLIEKSSPKATVFDKRATSTVACFTGEVEFIGSVPPQNKSFFFIADTNTIIDQILDIIDVDRFGFNFLDDPYVAYFLNVLFDAPHYRSEKDPVESEAIDTCQNTVEIESILTVDSELALNGKYEEVSVTKSIVEQVEEFISSDTGVLIANGATGSNHRSVAESIREAAFESGYSEVRVLTYSNRIKRILSQQYDEVESAYAAIYDFTNESIDPMDESRRLIPLQEPVALTWTEHFESDGLDAADDVSPRKTLFVVVEAQLITDSHNGDRDILFGTGSFLSDLLTYAQIGIAGSQNKIAFLGDKYLLSYGGWDLSCMNPAYFQGRKMSVQVVELPDPINPTPIQQVCLDVVECMRQDDYVSLSLADEYPLTIIHKEEEAQLLVEAGEQRFGGVNESKILVYSNQQALSINKDIKETVFGSGDNLAADDLIVFGNQVKAFGVDRLCASSPFESLNQPFNFTEPKRVANGTFGKILSVDYSSTFESSGEDSDENGEACKLHFVPAQVKLEDGAVLRICVLNEYIESESAALTKAQEREYQIFLKRLLSKEYDRQPFDAKSRYFQEMIDSGDYQKIEENGKERYRQKGDKRKLTKYEVQHRDDVRLSAESNADSLYFQVLNVARIRYGWALTVHRAVAYQWPIVIVGEREGGRSNPEYFKWLYTAMSRSLNQVKLVRWTDITLFDKTVFSNSSRSQGDAQSKSWIHCEGGVEAVSVGICNSLEGALMNSGIRVVSQKSHQYLELISVAKGTSSSTIIFDYNKKGEIRFPRYLKGNRELFDEVKSLLEKKEQDDVLVADHSVSKIAAQFEDFTGSHMLPQTVKGFEVIAEISDGSSDARVQLFRNKVNQVTQFNYVSGSREYFDLVVTLLAHKQSS